MPSNFRFHHPQIPKKGRSSIGLLKRHVTWHKYRKIKIDLKKKVAFILLSFVLFNIQLLDNHSPLYIDSDHGTVVESENIDLISKPENGIKELNIINVLNELKLNNSLYDGIKKNNSSLNNVYPTRSHDGRILPQKPVYKCRAKEKENVRKTKFIFVHVFKTAGTTMRKLFRNYAMECHSGVAIIAKCSNVTARSIDNDEEWKSPTTFLKGKVDDSSAKCILKDYIHRSGVTINESGPMRNSFLDIHMDILAGHVSLGSGFNWKVRYEMVMPAEIQYISFFREDVERTVSGLMYYSVTHKGLPDSLEDFVKHCKSQIKKRISVSYSEVYNKYLITPQQREDPAYADLNVVDRTNLTMKNILEFKVMVGIVEKMPQSLEMLHYLMDGNNEVTRLFSDFSEKKFNSMNKKSYVPEITTGTVVAELKKDDAFMEIMNEYLKYDVAIYDFANRVHEKQYATYQKQNKRPWYSMFQKHMFVYNY